MAFAWWPDLSGGTEVYVKGLAEELGRLGVENVISAPAAGKSDIGYRISDGDSGLKVWRFKCNEKPGDLGEIYGEGDPVAAENFRKVLDAENPDIVHFHAWSPAVSILLVREVKRRGIRMVQTYHTPTLSCPRGTLMRWGKIVCDGNLATRPCVACAIQGKLGQGFRIQGEALHRTSPNPESRIQNPKRSKIKMLISKLTTMFRMPGLIRKSIAAIRESFDAADRIVALNQWSYDLLARNRVPKDKLQIIRHGVPAK